MSWFRLVDALRRFLGHTDDVRDDELTAESRHRAATAEYAAASAEYECAAMSGDETAVAAADLRLAEADRVYGETLAAVVSQDQDRCAARARPSGDPARRRALPSFEEMLRHPWAQPDRDGTVLGSIVYSQAVPQSAGLPLAPPVIPTTPSLAPSAAIASSPHDVAWKSLFGDTSDRLVSH